MTEFEIILNECFKTSGRVLRCDISAIRNASIIHTKGDGLCLWYSIVISGLLQQGCCNSELDKYDKQGKLYRAADRLRSRICIELKANKGGGLKPRYSSFWAPGEEGAEFAKSESHYLDLLSTGKVYGGALEIHALTNILTCAIVLLDEKNDGFVYVKVIKSDGWKPDQKVFCLLRRGLHYDAIHINLDHISLDIMSTRKSI